MKYVRFLSSLLRTREWLFSRITFNISIVFCFLILNNKSIVAEASVLIPIVLYIVSIGSLGYFVNDVFDRKADEIAGKPNTSTSLSLLLIILVILFLFIAGTVPFLFLLPNYQVYFILLGIQLLLFVLYSVPWFRLKRTKFGVFCDALYAYIFPGLIVLWITTVSLRIDMRFNCEFLLFMIWLFLLGFRSIVFHQIVDFKNDLKARQKTFVISIGKEKSLQIIKASAIIEIILFLILISLLKLFYPVIVIALFLLLGVIIASDYRKKNQTKFVFETINHFYDYCIFMSCMLYFSWLYHPLFAILPVVYMFVKLNVFSWLYYKPILWFYYKAEGVIRRIKQ